MTTLVMALRIAIMGHLGAWDKGGIVGHGQGSDSRRRGWDTGSAYILYQDLRFGALSVREAKHTAPMAYKETLCSYTRTHQK